MAPDCKQPLYGRDQTNRSRYEYWQEDTDLTEEEITAKAEQMRKEREDELLEKNKALQKKEWNELEAKEKELLEGKKVKTKPQVITKPVNNNPPKKEGELKGGL